MKIISWNVNGLRSVYQKGFPAWLEKSDADIVCVQEVKAQASTVPQNLFGAHLRSTSSPRCEEFPQPTRRDEETVAEATAPRSNDVGWGNDRNPKGFSSFRQFRRCSSSAYLSGAQSSSRLGLAKMTGIADGGTSEMSSGSKYTFVANYAERPGYSGVGVYVKEKPQKIETKLGHTRFDSEGRMVRLDYPEFTFIGLYIPNGSRDKRDMTYKVEVYQSLFEYLKSIKKKNIILAGDFNIAHEEIDLARPKENKNSTMFTLEERQQIDTLESLGFIDSFRSHHKEGNHYSWWPYFANARERNLGWRIDYVFVSKALTPKLKGAFILPAITGSDHCPVGIEI